MKNIAEQIAEGLDRFYKAFQRKRVLKSLEEISATTNEDDLASATAVAALNNKLSGCAFETREDGAYVKYTLPGGADPVVKKLGDENKKYKITGQLSVTLNTTVGENPTAVQNVSFVHSGTGVSDINLPSANTYSNKAAVGVRATLQGITITEIN